MIKTESIAHELRKRGNKTVKFVIFNNEPAHNLSIVLKDDTIYNYSKEGRLVERTTVGEVCDYIQNKDKKLIKPKVEASKVSKWRGSKGNGSSIAKKKTSKLKKAIKKIIKRK